MQFYMNTDREHISKEAYEQIILMPFENLMVNVPIGYDEVLKAYYTDSYMTPVQYGASHEYPWFAKAERQLRLYYQQHNINFPKEYE